MIKPNETKKSDNYMLHIKLHHEKGNMIVLLLGGAAISKKLYGSSVDKYISQKFGKTKTHGIAGCKRWN